MTRGAARRTEDGALPTPAQVDLLRAALLGGDDARRAWARWRARGLTLERLDRASHRVLPRLWLNREAAGIDAADLPLLSGIYRHALAKNALLLGAALRGVAALEAQGVPVVIIKGAAMLARDPDRLGARTLDDLDVLVPEERAHEAMTVLEEAGFMPDVGAPRKLVETRHAWRLRSGDGAIDLHWHAYKTPGDDSVVFADAAPARLAGVDVRVPQATEAMLQTLAHGVGPVPGPVRWIADAIALLDRAGGEIDWAALVRRARERQTTVAAAAALAVLTAELGAPVPGWVVAELAETPTAWRERFVHRVARRSRPRPPYAWRGWTRASRSPR